MTEGQALPFLILMLMSPMLRMFLSPPILIVSFAIGWFVSGWRGIALAAAVFLVLGLLLLVWAEWQFYRIPDISDEIRERRLNGLWFSVPSVATVVFPAMFWAFLGQTGRRVFSRSSRQKVGRK